jgi:hypothetical protein
VTFECSDGTKAPSLAACLDNMARARLPPSQQAEKTPIEPAEMCGAVPLKPTEVTNDGERYARG